MTDPFFTVDQVEALRAYAAPALQTPISIYRRTVTSEDYGDDNVAYVFVSSVLGWLYSTPTTIQEIDTGALVTANTYRLFVAVGTDIRPGDEVHCGSDVYNVSDTTYESTWNVVMRCSLRRRE